MLSPKKEKIHNEMVSRIIAGLDPGSFWCSNCNRVKNIEDLPAAIKRNGKICTWTEMTGFRICEMCCRIFILGVGLTKTSHQKLSEFISNFNETEEKSLCRVCQVSNIRNPSEIVLPKKWWP